MKPKVDEKLKVLESLRKKAKEQERGHELRNVIEQLSKKQAEYKLMEKSLRKRCETLEAQVKTETQKYIEGKDTIKKKKDLLRHSNVCLLNFSCK